jgi:hypothetical protein
MKTSELSGAALDWAVHQAWCEGACHDEPFPSYSTNWAPSGPIIERKKIEIFIRDEEWFAHSQLSTPEDFHGDTPLIAAMRCFVASQLGDEVNVPEGLA